MINIKTAGKNEEMEVKGKEQLERILKRYDLSKYFFTTDVVFESYTIPTSHPVLTLNTRQLDDDDKAMSVFIHEELHWYLNQNSSKVEKTVNELREIYHDVPVGNPKGAKNESSTYEHLIVCFLEYEEMKKLIGEKRTIKVIQSFDYYTWIYQKVLNDYFSLKKVVEKNGLMFE